MTEQERDEILLSLQGNMLSLQNDMRDVRTRVGNVETRLDAVDAKIDAVRGEVEILGRETRAGWAVLKRDMPQAVVAAVDRTFGSELRALREDVDELKEAAG